MKDIFKERANLLIYYFNAIGLPLSKQQEEEIENALRWVESKLIEIGFKDMKKE